MTLFRRTAILFALAAATVAHAGTLSFETETYRLPNGLTVTLHEDHSLPQVVVNVRVGVGSKDERAGRSGFAHLFEHLMFKATKNYPEGHFDNAIETEGGRMNAATSRAVRKQERGRARESSFLSLGST